MNWTTLYAWVVAATLTGCREDAKKVTPSSAPPATSATASTGPHRDRSIYALPLILSDQDGAPIGLDVFRGKPVLIGMFYATCPSACPLLISTIKRVMADLDPTAGAEVRVLLVSFDPERDTPEALRKIATTRGLDRRWKLASAPDDDVRDLAAVLGIQYRRLPDGNFSHTSSIVLLDRTGTIDMRLDDTGQPVAALVTRATALAAEPN